MRDRCIPAAASDPHQRNAVEVDRSQTPHLRSPQKFGAACRRKFHKLIVAHRNPRIRRRSITASLQLAEFHTMNANAKYDQVCRSTIEEPLLEGGGNAVGHPMAWAAASH
jgi:hypothetical protein